MGYPRLLRYTKSGIVLKDVPPMSKNDAFKFATVVSTGIYAILNMAFT